MEPCPAKRVWAGARTDPSSKAKTPGKPTQEPDSADLEQQIPTTYPTCMPRVERNGLGGVPALPIQASLSSPWMEVGLYMCHYKAILLQQEPRHPLSILDSFAMAWHGLVSHRCIVDSKSVPRMATGRRPLSGNAMDLRNTAKQHVPCIRSKGPSLPVSTDVPFARAVIDYLRRISYPLSDTL